MERIFITKAGPKAAEAALSFAGSEKFAYAYFGEDSQNAMRIQDRIQAQGESISISSKLQSVSNRIRQKYIDYIGLLGNGRRDSVWLAGRVSEKNIYVSKTLLYISYLIVGLEIAKERPGKIVFFVENGRMAACFAKNLGSDAKNGWRIGAAGRLARNGKRLLNKTLFLAAQTGLMLLSRYRYRLQRPAPKDPGVLIHTFINRKSFDEQNKFHESYYGTLPTRIESRGTEVYFVPMMGRSDYLPLMGKMAKSDSRFLFPPAYLQPQDALWAVWQAAAHQPKFNSFPPFDGLDISDLIKNDLETDATGTRVEQALLYQKLFARLKKKGFDARAGLSTFENHNWERLWCAGAREQYPNIKLAGYQHSTFSRMHTNQFISQGERGLIPLPDTILTNGEYYSQALEQGGYEPAMIKLAGAIRYEYLFTAEKKPQKAPGGKPAVLVILSISQEETLEMLQTVRRAWESDTQLEVRLKFHPFLPYARLGKAIGFGLPSHFKVVDGNLADLIAQSDAVVYTGSTACLEAMAAGVPIVHVLPQRSLDTDPLDFSSDLRPSAATVEELRAQVAQAAALGPKEKERLRASYSKTLELLFRKPDESVYQIFLDALGL